jgi:predicted kinase
VRRNLLDVLKPTHEHSDSKLDRIRQRTEELLEQLRPMIDRRALRGVTRDCHGDLHLDHIYYFPERSPPDDLVIVDCIEFNERFRFIDPIADMAFPAMDFIYHGRRDLADTFCEAYFHESGDQEGRALLDLHIAYRASVRAYVDSLKFLETEVPRGERRQAMESATAHALLALVQLEPPACRPCLLLVAGLPGTGKSTLARALAARAGFEIVRSDAVRKELAARQQHQADLYTKDWDRRTYAACLEQAASLLRQGKRVIVDATFRREHDRHSFLQAARRWCVPAGMLLCQAEPSVIQVRLKQRRQDVSDADWPVYQMLAQAWEPLGSQAASLTRTVDTGAEQEVQVMSCALAALVEFGMWG